MKNWIKKNWEKYPVQMMGAGWVMLAIVATWFAEWGIAAGCYGMAVLVESYLLIKHALWKDFQMGQETDTISQWVQAITDNKIVDYMIMAIWITITVVSYARHFGWETTGISTLFLMANVLAVHFFMDKD